MQECFHPDSTVRLSWFQGTGPDFVARSKDMSGRGHKTTHRLCPPVVQLYGDRAVVEVSAGIEMRADFEGVEADLTSFARLLYRAERRSYIWRIVSLDAIYERDSLLPALPGAQLRLDPDELAAFRPTYRVLAYQLSRLGYDIAEDAYGDDQPDRVEGLYRSAFAWARHTIGADQDR
jgi:hypothetical protein